METSAALRERVELVAAAAEGIVAFEAIGLALPPGAAGTLTVLWTDRRRPAQEHVFGVAEVPSALGHPAGTPLRVLGDELDARRPFDRALLTRGVRALLALPIAGIGRSTHLWIAFADPVFPAESQERALLALARLGDLPAAPATTDPEVARQLPRLEALDQLLAALTGALDVRDVFVRISEIAKQVIPHDCLGMPIVADDDRHLLPFALTDAVMPDLPARLPIDDLRILTDPWEYTIVDDIRLKPRKNIKPFEAAGYRGQLRLPIRLEGKLVAILDFWSFTPGAYSRGDVLVARRIADHVALALSHQRLAQEARRATEAQERAVALESRVQRLSEELESMAGPRRVVGRSEAWTRVLTQATRVAATDTTVLLLGESGTGKEVVARLIHRASSRSAGPFVALNCAALPDQLLESELFGFERGAFTGASQTKPGQIERATGGVLFLDEIAELSPSAQAKCLRVLQEREFQRLGGTRVLRADVRVIAATNRDLRHATEQGHFREDLYYRLQVFEIHLPPLRERRDDVVPLSEALLGEIATAFGRPPARLSPEARQTLLRYPWPGNVRELRNTLERALILSDGATIRSEHLGLGPPADAPRAAEGRRPPAPDAQPSDLRSVERALIEKALEDSRHNKSKAARLLGLTRTQLYVRLRKHGLA